MGVRKRGKRWAVDAYLNSKKTYLGTFDFEDEAQAIFEAAKATATTDRKVSVKKKIKELNNIAQGRAPKRESDPDPPTSLYRAFDADGDLLYIGVTSQRQQRLYRHAKVAQWWQKVATIEIQHYATATEAKLAEADQIGRLHPPHNRNHRRAVETVIKLCRCVDCGSMFRGRTGGKYPKTRCMACVTAEISRGKEFKNG